ncbi:MAG: riboflavin biosynthesis protein RibD, partial [Flavobacteriales bacterium]
GGAKTLENFIKTEYWDEARVLIGENTLGEGLRAPVLPTKSSSSQLIGKDKVYYYKKEKKKV